MDINIVFDCLENNSSGRSAYCNTFKVSGSNSRDLVQRKIDTLAPLGYTVYALVRNRNAVVLNAQPKDKAVNRNQKTQVQNHRHINNGAIRERNSKVVYYVKLSAYYSWRKVIC